MCTAWLGSWWPFWSSMEAESPPASSTTDVLPASSNSRESFTSSQVTITINSPLPYNEKSLPSLPETGTPAVGYKEELSNYQRVSPLSLILFCSIVLLAMTIYCLVIVKHADDDWDQVTCGTRRIPSPRPRTGPGRGGYFEGQYLKNLSVGKLIKTRLKWKKHGVSYGLDHSSWYLIFHLVALSTFLFLKIAHFIASCMFKPVRRCFQLISLGYGFLGLFLICLTVSTLYFEFVHQVSSYLQNAYDPPDPAQLNVSKEDVELFVNLCYFCAFTYSKPNEYAKTIYGSHWKNINSEYLEFKRGTERYSYSKSDVMDMTLCPRQNYMIAVVCLLSAASLFSWIAAAYSESVENTVIGPPIWLCRFQVETSRGIRTWKTRSLPPPGLKKRGRKPRRSHHRLGNQPDSWFDSCGITDDPYGVLDGGRNHFLLVGPIDLIAVSSTPCMYRSQSLIQFRGGCIKQEKS